MYLNQKGFQLFLFCWLLGISFASSNALDNYEIKLMEQKAVLKNCRIKIQTYALYICDETVFVFKRNDVTKRFIDKIYQIDKAIDADIQGPDIVVIGHDSVTFLVGQNFEEHARVSQESPVLSRLDVQNEFTRLIIISRPEVDDGIVSSEKVQDEYIIHSFLLGGGPHIHHIRLPREAYDVEIDDSSFKDMRIYNDEIFGLDYLFVIMKHGKVYIYQSIFQDPQFNFYQELELDEGFEIIDTALEEDYLFLLISNKEHGDLKLNVYKINPTREMVLTEECSVDLKDFNATPLSPSRPPQIQAKQRFNAIYVILNFPGRFFLSYSFQKPSVGIYKAYCPNPSALVKNEYHFNDTGETGYHFDYDIGEQNIILSPSSQGRTYSYQIPFCSPSYYLVDKSKCTACKEGSSSQGGFQSSCRACPVDKNHILDQNTLSTLNNTCPFKCKTSNRFGENCVECGEYLDSIGAQLPANSYPIVNEKGECSFKCKDGETNEASGSCIVGKELVNIVQNKCSQIKDCMNCSFSPSCSWCSGSCYPFHVCNPSRRDKQALFNDFIHPALNCNREPATKAASAAVCGQSNHHNSTGNFSFQSSNVSKNQICSWYVQPNFQAGKNVTFTVHHGLPDGKEIDNPPNLFVAYCLVEFFFKSCHIVPIALRPEEPLTFVGSNVQLFAWVEEDMIGQNYKIEYEMFIDQSFFDNIFKLLLYLVRILSVCVLFSCMANSFQRYAMFSRRRRIMRELEGLELIGFIDNNGNFADEPEVGVNADEIMQDNRVISGVKYNDENLNEFEQTECPICLETFANEENLAKLQCKHIFHRTCLHDWIQAVNVRQQVKCPVCNRVLL